jgi:hypothetical protein
MNLIRTNSHHFLSRTAQLGFLIAISCAISTYAQAPSAAPLGDFSGLYTFVRDGESVQITVDEVPSKEKPEVPVRGYVSRIGDTDTDKDQVLDMWIKSGSTDADRIRFSTKQVHGVAYDFDGHIRRGDAKAKGKEGYIVIEGTLTEHRLDKNLKSTTRERQLTMKSFPDLDQ